MQDRKSLKLSVDTDVCLGSRNDPWDTETDVRWFLTAVQADIRDRLLLPARCPLRGMRHWANLGEKLNGTGQLVVYLV